MLNKQTRSAIINHISNQALSVRRKEALARVFVPRLQLGHSENEQEIAYKLLLRGQWWMTRVHAGPMKR